MQFMESREKLGPQVRLGAVCWSVLPEGLGPEADQATTSACCCQRQVGMTTPRFSGLVKERRKGKACMKNKRETALGVWGAQGGDHIKKSSGSGRLKLSPSAGPDTSGSSNFLQEAQTWTE